MTYERFSAPPAGWDTVEGSAALPTQQSLVAQSAAPTPPLEIDGRAAIARAGIERLAQAGTPEGLTQAEWRLILKDMRRVAVQWLDIALVCGWSLTDLYGSTPVIAKPIWRCAVAFTLRGRPIEAIDNDRIVIANRIGPPNVHYRKAPGCAQPIDRSYLRPAWDVIAATSWS